MDAPPWVPKDEGALARFLADLDPHETAVVLLAAILALLLFGRVLREVGFSRLDSATLLVIPPVVGGYAFDVGSHEPTSTLLAVNAAGFLVPFALAAKFLVLGAAPVGRAVFALAVVSLVAHGASFAVPSEGVLIYYRVPAVAAAGLAVALRWGRWHEAGPLAFVAGAGGVIIGADAFRLHELMYEAPSPHRIILGGAGVLDGIFLVGALAVALTAFAKAIEHAARGRVGAGVPQPRGATSAARP